MKKSGLRAKLVFRFMIIIVISVGLLEVMIINFVKKYHYDNIEGILTNQIKISSDFYYKYFSNTSLEENVSNNVDVYWKQTDAQVQIINKNGKLLMDSIGVKDEVNKGDDIEKALSGGKGVWKGTVKYHKSKVMAISYPLKSKSGDVEGAIRFITSLEEVDKAVFSISSFFLVIGIFVIIATALVSIVIANRIIDPIKELTLVAETMAEGNFKVRSEEYTRDDEIGKLSTTLNYMADEILKRDEIKNQFISNVSHELRTPLTSIKGWAITLNYDDIDKSMVKDGLTIIERECDRLSEMVEELLDFSKFVSGRIVLNKTNVDIFELLDYIDKHTRLRTEREGISLIIESEENLGRVLIDENRVKQVLINLLDNAIKFTDRNGEIVLKAYKEAGKLVFLVKDSGCGITEEELPKVKEKFYKGKSSKSKNGIGLSICDEIAKLHSGELVIKSKVNLGTEVYVYIPTL